jgi:DMSO/TMAO reductase YedYZ molybdopterin-dependent catalytic subunit
MTRRRTLQGLLAGGSAVLLAGCDRLGRSPAFRGLLFSAERLTYRAQRLVVDRNTLAREFDIADLSPVFRTNGNTLPADACYQQHLSEGFANWRLVVDGEVEMPASLSLADLSQLPQRTQITRHDCVEGWSAIGQWTGVPLKAILDRVVPKASAKFVIFHCADDFHGTPYYESIDMVDAYHPQTILAHSMNGAKLPVGHGAPLRLRVERQLGYKHAKFVMRIEVAGTLQGIGAGKGGYWEDAGDYEWYAGI